MSTATLSIDDMYFPPRRNASRPAIGAQLAVALPLLNLFGGLVSGLWLLVTGDWGLVVGGVVACFAMPWAFTIIGAPILALVARASRTARPPRSATIAAGIPRELWTAVLITAWTLTVFLAFTQRAEQGLTVPLMIWGYATAMAPLAYLAKSQHGDSLGAHLGLLLAMGAYAMLVVLHSAGAEPFPMTVAALALAVAEGLYCAISGAAAHGRFGNLRPA